MADFQNRINEFNENGIRVIAASVDKLEDAEEMVKRNNLAFPLAYGTDGKGFSEATGAFFDLKKGFLHATGFIIRPDGTLMDAVYSTGPIGRLAAADTIRLINFRKKMESQSKA